MLSALQVQGFRNLAPLRLQLSPSTNFIHGANGSGKTSVLEAIYFLASGKSFRSSKIESVIGHEAQEITVYCELESDTRIGVRKARRKPYELKLDGGNQTNWDAVASIIPVQILDASAFALLEGGPSARRKFLDWGVFHVEPSFVLEWRNTRKCLANRNHLLKQSSLDSGQLGTWERELLRAAERVDSHRVSYFDRLRTAFLGNVNELIGRSDLTIEYRRGWKGVLLESLRQGFESDRKAGFTHAGPHRADVEVKCGTRLAVEVLSRGQQKMLVSALKIAQGDALSEMLDKRCVYLVDDLAAELDVSNRDKVMDRLSGLGGQLFVTAIEENALDSCLPRGGTAFHVEHGIINN